MTGGLGPPRGNERILVHRRVVLLKMYWSIRSKFRLWHKTPQAGPSRQQRPVCCVRRLSTSNEERPNRVTSPVTRYYALMWDFIEGWNFWLESYGYSRSNQTSIGHVADHKEYQGTCCVVWSELKAVALLIFIIWRHLGRPRCFAKGNPRVSWSLDVCAVFAARIFCPLCTFIWREQFLRVPIDAGYRSFIAAFGRAIC